MGEIRIDVRARLPGISFADLHQDQLTFAPVDLRVSGTALNFAQCGRDYFDAVDLIARVGEDSFTPLIQAKLGELGISGHLLIESAAPNGLVMVVHDAPRNGARPARLMVASTSSPAMALTLDDIVGKAAVLERSDALLVDGYALLYERSAEAVRVAAEITRAAGGVVCFDLVPHDIQDRIPAEATLSALRLADVVISQLNTLTGLLHNPQAQARARDDPAALLTSALDRAMPHDPLWFIRSGPNAIDSVFAYQRGALRRRYFTGYRPHMEPMGFGDRLTACELYWLLSARAIANPAAASFNS
jgi:sugar/nucleoside kinase (ribokinase family)